MSFFSNSQERGGNNRKGKGGKWLCFSGLLNAHSTVSKSQNQVGITASLSDAFARCQSSTQRFISQLKT